MLSQTIINVIQSLALTKVKYIKTILAARFAYAYTPTATSIRCLTDGLAAKYSRIPSSGKILRTKFNKTYAELMDALQQEKR